MDPAFALRYVDISKNTAIPTSFFAFPAKAGNQRQALHSSGLRLLDARFRGQGENWEMASVRVLYTSSRPRRVDKDRMIEKRACVYILANHRNGTLYVGVTRDIARRGFEHRMGAVAGFTHRYNVHLLVFVEFHESMAEAVMREKRIKKWRRAWKLALIERDNPEWRDLYDDLML
jgi:putative endonuclease